MQTKKKDAFLNFVKDAGFIAPNRTVGHDKYTKFDITDFGRVVFGLGADSEAAWGLMLSIWCMPLTSTGMLRMCLDNGVW